MMKDGNDRNRPHSGKIAKDSREARLKRALRENLKRRKSQAKERGDFARASSASDEGPRDKGGEGPAK
jgi:hypothetical protein